LRSAREAGVQDAVVVLGHQAAMVRAGVAGAEHGARFVENAAYRDGQLSSLLVGLDAADRPGVRAVMMTLVDVPLVSPDTIRAVVARYEASGAPIVRPVHGEQHGHPVLIDRSLFDLLRTADPAIGAKDVVRRFASPAGDVVVDDAGAFVDVDTPDEYSRIAGGDLSGR
jgi:molybdenum cofactor cytidylyltransferase